MDKAGKEKRRFERINVSFIITYKVDLPLTVRIKVGDKWFDSVALDLSEGGMAMLINHEFPVKTLVTVKFILVNDKAILRIDRYRSMEVEAEVCYSVLVQGRSYRTGLCFVSITEEERTFIAHFVKGMLPA
ncbi:MAG: PilZ domain-containing protein [Candidatus Omnitrophota bacterium]